VNDTMTLLAEVEEFVGDHRPHGTLACDVTEPAWNGYLLTGHVRAESCSSAGSRQRMPSWTCSGRRR